MGWLLQRRRLVPERRRSRSLETCLFVSSFLRSLKKSRGFSPASEGLPFFRRIIPHKAVNAKMAVRYAVSITSPTTLPCPENPTNCFPAPIRFDVGKIASGFADRDQARDRSTLNVRHDEERKSVEKDREAYRRIDVNKI